MMPLGFRPIWFRPLTRVRRVVPWRISSVPLGSVDEIAVLGTTAVLPPDRG